MTEPQQQAQRIEVWSQSEDLLAHLSGLLSAVDKGLAVELSQNDLAPLEYLLLRNCQEMEECTATQLAEVLPTDASRISRMVTRLVNEGYLRRRRLVHDRRVVMLRLTEKGRELTDLAGQRIRLYTEALIKGIGREDIDALLSTATHILANYDDYFSQSQQPEG